MDETKTGNSADVKDHGGYGTHVAGSIAAGGKLKAVLIHFSKDSIPSKITFIISPI
ncbi:hypothetical protein [Bacillus cereus group sp. BfR-BA-01380]|uniref:hypothetical protein n=1 Tax=Bacillus cereus group sp. BfR-BA-01380 TaxID=2920324 RepID=UPI001F594018|nr:hypothetical protein [Bacillus cereus group sp. BfR-BA-01380]